VLPTIVMVTALYFTLERQPMQLSLLKEGDWGGILTMAIGLSALQNGARGGQQGRLVLLPLHPAARDCRAHQPVAVRLDRN